MTSGTPTRSMRLLCLEVTSHLEFDVLRLVNRHRGQHQWSQCRAEPGVLQVGEVVTQMDRTTQQNAALVEESAAAAEGLKVQASRLVEAVAVFHLVQDDVAHRARRGPVRAR